MIKKTRNTSKRKVLNAIQEMKKKKIKIKFTLPQKTYEQVSEQLSYESLNKPILKKG